jgi:SAM-dependent methyltransferase
LREWLKYAAAGLGLYKDSRSTRERLSFRYIRGSGLEIGALHSPLPVGPGVRVRYVDRVDRRESIRRFPELEAGKIIDPDVIDDGFLLASIPGASQDFVIANHVLEHAMNPLQVLLNWTRVLRSGGVLFASVPVAEKCFDRGRPVTELEHLIRDFEIGRSDDREAFSERNRVHYGEWLRISEPNILAGRKEPYSAPSQEEMDRRIEFLLARSEEIHFHAFSSESFEELLSYFTGRTDTAMKLETVESNGEVIGVMRKTRSGG